jgi:hypothetical protein
MRLVEYQSIHDRILRLPLQRNAQRQAPISISHLPSQAECAWATAEMQAQAAVAIRVVRPLQRVKAIRG